MNRTYNCSYCNGEGKNYTEAADLSVAKWIINLNDERKDAIIRYITGKGEG